MTAQTQSVSAAPRQLLLFLRNGPNNQPEKHEFRAEQLSLLGPSELWTFGKREVTYRCGDCLVRCIGYQTRRSLSRFRFMARVGARALYLRWIRGTRLIVCAPDPFWNGALSYLIKVTCRARFICEINGNFTNPGNVVEVTDPVKRQQKFDRMNRVGNMIASRADHLKLLYPGQVDGFPGAASVPQTAFLELYFESKYDYHELGHEPILVFVGYPFLLKGVDTLLEAFAVVREQFPEWRLALIGHGLKRRAAIANLPTAGVEFLGPLPWEEVAAWMARSQALVLPSRAEGMGRVLLEAARVGRARVGSRVGGIPHYIEDGVDGLLFEAGNAVDLTSVLTRLLSDQSLRARLGIAARERAEREFTTDNWIRGWRRILEASTAGT